MKYTLLELTQRILSSMESDEVSSISETTEASDVANIIKECYFDIVGQGDLSEHQGLFKLDASTDNTKPVVMTIPSNVIKVDWLKYNFGSLAGPDYTILRYVDPEEFIHIQTGMDDDDPTVSSFSLEVNKTDFVFRYRSDRYPGYYTIFDEKFVVMNSFDRDVESTLTQVRTLGFGMISPEFRMEDSFVPDLDHRQFQLLLQEAKAVAHVELKQQANPKAEAKARRNWILAQKSRDDNDPSKTRQPHYSFGRTRTYGRIRFPRS